MYKKVILGLVIASSSSCFQSPSFARESRGLDDLAKFNVSQSKDVKLSSQACYSKAFDKWLNFYLMGEFEKSDKAWAQVLLQIKAAQSSTPLMKRAVPRLLFADIPKGSPLKTVEIRKVFKQWVKVAKATMGVNHRFVGDAYASMANYYESQRIYRNAAMYRRKQTEVYKVCFGATNRRAIRALYYYAKNLFLGENFEKAELALKEAIKSSEKAKYSEGTRESVKLYLSLLRKTNRTQEAKRLTGKYRGVI